MVQHASPTLAGIKTANLFQCKADCEQEISTCIQNWNHILNPKGIRLSILKYKRKHALIYLFRQQLLQKTLLDIAHIEFLSRFGYDCHCVDSCLEHLKIRLRQHDFPHEIGVFLGYPLHDIKAFIANAGQHYTMSGYWKVYENVVQAEKIFGLYQRCTKEYCTQFAKGKAITQLVAAGK